MRRPARSWSLPGDFGSDIILRTYTTDTEYLLDFFADLFVGGEHTELMERVFSIGGSEVHPLPEEAREERETPGSRPGAGLLATLSRETVEPLTVRMLGRMEGEPGRKVLSAGD